MKRKFFWLAIWLAACCWLLSIGMTGSKLSFSEQFAETYGVIILNSSAEFLASFIRWILPQVIFCEFLGNIVEEELYTVLPYILTRTNRIKKFWMKVYGKLILITSGFVIWYLLCFQMITAIQTSGKNDHHFMIMILWGIYQVLCVVLVNAWTAYFPTIYGISGLFLAELFFWFLQKCAESGLILKEISYVLPVRSVWFSNGSEQMPKEVRGMILFALFILAVIVFDIKRKKDIL